MISMKVLDFQSFFRRWESVMDNIGASLRRPVSQFSAVSSQRLPRAFISSPEHPKKEKLSMKSNQESSAAEVLTWSAVLHRVEHDPNYPSDRRAYDKSRLKKALDWNAAPTWTAARSPVTQPSKFAERPFTRRSIDELFDELRPGELRLKQKTLDTARSACKRVADDFGIPTGIAKTPFSNDCARLLELLGKPPNTKAWVRYRLTRAMRYLSYIGVSPWDMTDSIADGYATALVSEFQIAEPRDVFRMFTRTWNQCVEAVPGFPQILLSRRICTNTTTVKWSDYSELSIEIDAYLACGSLVREDPAEAEICEIDLDDDFEISDPLSAASIKSSKQKLRLAISALKEDGVACEELKTLCDLGAPRRYHQAMRKLIDRTGGVVNHHVLGLAKALFRVAGHRGVLTKDELKAVRVMFKKHCKRHTLFLKTFEHRDQETLDQLDDPSVMDALLSLPTRTVNGVLAMRNRHTLQCAYAVQRALALELWLCAPYRIGAFSSIEIDQIVSMRIKNTERVLLRAPKKQSENKKSPEHFLNDDTVVLLELYIDEYRPIILKSLKVADSAFLFPGRDGHAKASKSLGHQMTQYVKKNTVLKKWHPHVMRKIAPKITLDGDPGAFEVARRTGGWKNGAMLRDVYGQQVHRASQARYIELLEDRRLTAKRSVVKRRGR